MPHSTPLIRFQGSGFTYRTRNTIMVMKTNEAFLIVVKQHIISINILLKILTAKYVIWECRWHCIVVSAIHQSSSLCPFCSIKLFNWFQKFSVISSWQCWFPINDYHSHAKPFSIQLKVDICVSKGQVISLKAKIVCICECL